MTKSNRKGQNQDDFNEWQDIVMGDSSSPFEKASSPKRGDEYSDWEAIVRGTDGETGTQRSMGSGGLQISSTEVTEHTIAEVRLPPSFLEGNNEDSSSSAREPSPFSTPPPDYSAAEPVAPPRPPRPPIPMPTPGNVPSLPPLPSMPPPPPGLNSPSEPEEPSSYETEPAYSNEVLEEEYDQIEETNVSPHESAELYQLEELSEESSEHLEEVYEQEEYTSEDYGSSAEYDAAGHSYDDYEEVPLERDPTSVNAHDSSEQDSLEEEVVEELLEEEEEYDYGEELEDEFRPSYEDLSPVSTTVPPLPELPGEEAHAQHHPATSDSLPVQAVAVDNTAVVEQMEAMQQSMEGFLGAFQETQSSIHTLLAWLQERELRKAEEEAERRAAEEEAAQLATEAEAAEAELEELEEEPEERSSALEEALPEILSSVRELTGVYDEIFQLYDYITYRIGSHWESGEGSPVMQELTGVQDRILELLHRQGIERIENRSAFVPEEHRVLQEAAAYSPEEDGQISSVFRQGFKKEEKILRPAEVEIKRYTAKN